MNGQYKILFLCTGNSCRSQMAEGWARHLLPGLVEAHSAGLQAKGLNPRAEKVMREAGVDISGQRSKDIDAVKALPFDCVITVCGHADEHCPTFPGRPRHIHAPFDDPPQLALGAKTEEEALSHFRRVRDEIRTFVLTLPGVLGLQPEGEG